LILQHLAEGSLRLATPEPSRELSRIGGIREQIRPETPDCARLEREHGPIPLSGLDRPGA